MSLTSDELIVLRSWVGDGPTTSELDSLYTQYSDYDEVVRYVLRKRLSALTEEPASLSVPGLSYSNGINITSLESLLKRFDNEGGTGLNEDSTGGLRIARLVRQDFR